MCQDWTSKQAFTRELYEPCLNAEQASVQAHGSGEQRTQEKQVSATHQALNSSLPPGTFRENPCSFAKEFIFPSSMIRHLSALSEVTGQDAQGGI